MPQPPFPNLTPPTPKTTAANTPPTGIRFGQIRGRSIKILKLLEKESSRTVELGESLDYPPHYVWKYLNNLRKYGLVREQDYSWFLTDLGASFILKFLNKYTITETRKTLEREEKETRKTRKIETKQISLGLWQPKYPLDETASRVVEVMLEHYNTTVAEGKPQLGYTYPAYYDKWDIAKEFNIPIDEVDEVNRVLQNQGIGFLCRSYGGRLKRAFFEKWILMRKAEQKISEEPNK